MSALGHACYRHNATFDGSGRLLQRESLCACGEPCGNVWSGGSAVGASKITAGNNQNNGKTEEVLDNRPREGLYSYGYTLHFRWRRATRLPIDKKPPGQTRTKAEKVERKRLK
jgi:hypothetical protein